MIPLLDVLQHPSYHLPHPIFTTSKK
ncbi:unnamed protein product [Cuscuta europaea]|uniref:Uncharacterized protein n=1 Tax=Cuscuta europaea TaxID=41803 RepID=A0A9P0Z6S4_CUSEU|nr:unnamed protein product [Cuscuta europaea]